MRLLSFFACFLFVLTAHGQSGPAKRALKAIVERDLEKAGDQIRKGLEKDSADALLHYDIARFMLLIPGDQIDSAHHSETRSRNYFERLTIDDKEKYAKQGLTLISLDLLREEIDSLAYARAENLMSESSFNYFLDNYADAAQRGNAIMKRDSLAYRTALELNTYESYREFMEKYPGAEQVPLARERYERLFYEDATADGKRSSYIAFLEKNPATPYRDEIEFAIFRMSAVTPDKSALETIISAYPGRPVARHARNFLYYKSLEDSASPYLWNDSIRSIHQLSSEPWIPAYQKDEVVFLDQEGDEKFSIEREALSEIYRCQVLDDDIIIGNLSIYSRTGDVVYEGNFTEATGLTHGYVLLYNGDRKGLITKWGLNILPPVYDEIRILPSGMITARNNSGWGLYTFLGMAVMPHEYEDILFLDGVYQMLTQDRSYLMSDAQLTEVVAGNSTVSAAGFDDVEFIEEDRIWARIDDDETLLDDSLNPLIGADFQRIEIGDNAYVIRRPDETVLRSRDFYQKYTTREKLIDYNDDYVIFTSANGFGLFDLRAFRFVALPDSARTVGEHGAVAFFSDGIAVYQYGKELIRRNKALERLEVLAREDREWIILKDRTRPGLITEAGAVALPAYQSAQMLTDSLLILDVKSRKGLYDISGHEVLPASYNGMANFDGRDLSLLRNGRFGVYRPAEKMLIQPAYEKIPQPYGDYYFGAVKAGKKGLVDKTGKEVVPFIYDEIRYWNDTVALVQSEDTYSFHTIGGKVLEGLTLTSVKYLRDDSDEKLIMGFRDEYFGILSSKKGEILPPAFDDIINLGKPWLPVYFTEVYVEQADLHIVVYYNQYGEILRKQAMEPELFAEIYCDD